ncbi:MAG: PilZ domain-containing protein [Candidatus Omnitrophota bacterium]
MLPETETDKRKTSRADVHFMVAYGRMREDTIVDRDISQTKNLSEGGLAFTTSQPFTPQTNLSLKIKLPVTAEPVQITGTVIESREVNPHYIYFTRVTFPEMDEQKRRAIQQTIAYYVRKRSLTH